MDNINDILRTISILLVPLLFAITLHEAAHGWVANKLGDNTAKMLGRLTINPIPHIDIIGTILIPLASYFLAGFIFGYAKPTTTRPEPYPMKAKASLITFEISKE